MVLNDYSMKPVNVAHGTTSVQRCTDLLPVTNAGASGELVFMRKGSGSVHGRDYASRGPGPGNPERLLRPGRGDVQEGPVLGDDVLPVRRVDGGVKRSRRGESSV